MFWFDVDDKDKLMCSVSVYLWLMILAPFPVPCFYFVHLPVPTILHFSNFTNHLGCFHLWHVGLFINTTPCQFVWLDFFPYLVKWCLVFLTLFVPKPWPCFFRALLYILDLFSLLDQPFLVTSSSDGYSVIPWISDLVLLPLGLFSSDFVLLLF